MAAPTHTTRVAPSGNYDLYDGFVSKIAFSLDPNITFWEKSVKLPGLDGGAPINRSTMFNSTFVTKHPGGLVEVTDGSAKVAYCLQSYTDILAIINVQGIVTVIVCDGSQQSAFGYLQKFDPAELVPGTHPEATITIVFTMYDNANNVESTFLTTEVTGS